MTTLRLTRWRRCRSLLAAGLSIGIAVVAVSGPAVAAPGTPSPSPTVKSPTVKSPGAAVPPAGSITWAVQPSTEQGTDKRSSFSYTDIKPGTTIQDYVGVTNFSKMPVTFEVYATDAFVTSNGSLDLLAAATKPTDIGSWVKLLKTSITVPPSARVNEPFTLTVPANATPGDHTGGVIAAISVASTNTTGAKVLVDRRLAAPLFLRVSGPLRPALTVESFSTAGYHSTINPFGGGSSTVSYTIHNTGNVRLDTAQTVTVTGPFGMTLATAHPKALTDLLPGATLRVTQRVSEVFPAGPLTIHVRLTPKNGAGLPATGAAIPAFTRSAGMWATPWPQLLLLILLVALFFAGRWWLRSRRLRNENAVATAVAQARRETAEELTRTRREPASSGSGRSE